MACDTLYHNPGNGYGECVECGVLTCPQPGCGERLALDSDAHNCYCESCGWFDPRICPWPEKLNVNGLTVRGITTYVKGEPRGVVIINGATVPHQW